MSIMTSNCQSKTFFQNTFYMLASKIWKTQIIIKGSFTEIELRVKTETKTDISINEIDSGCRIRMEHS
jgi:hypothetical protein